MAGGPPPSWRSGHTFLQLPLACMGIYDREYIRERPRGGLGSFSFASVTTWLIVINVAVFFADGILLRMAMSQARQNQTRLDDDATDDEGPQPAAAPGYYLAMGPLTRWGYFSTDAAIRHGQV